MLWIRNLWFMGVTPLRLSRMVLYDTAFVKVLHVAFGCAIIVSKFRMIDFNQ